MSDEVLQVEEGSLYPALHRLEKRGFVESEWGQSEANRRARYYRLTRRGRSCLARQVASWSEMSGAIGKVLGEGAERVVSSGLGRRRGREAC